MGLRETANEYFLTLLPACDLSSSFFLIFLHPLHSSESYITTQLLDPLCSLQRLHRTACKASTQHPQELVSQHSASGTGPAVSFPHTLPQACTRQLTIPRFPPSVPTTPTCPQNYPHLLDLPHNVYPNIIVSPEAHRPQLQQPEPRSLDSSHVIEAKGESLARLASDRSSTATTPVTDRVPQLPWGMVFESTTPRRRREGVLVNKRMEISTL